MLKSKLKGGIEGIIALVILVGIVIALIIAVILPMTDEAKTLGDVAIGNTGNLTEELGGNRVYEKAK